MQFLKQSTAATVALEPAAGRRFGGQVAPLEIFVE